jgi:hypothetical protein
MASTLPASAFSSPSEASMISCCSRRLSAWSWTLRRRSSMAFSVFSVAVAHSIESFPILLGSSPPKTPRTIRMPSSPKRTIIAMNHSLRSTHSLARP